MADSTKVLNMTDTVKKPIQEDASGQDQLAALGGSYAEYLRPECNEQMHMFDDSIEDLLTRLDEYHGLLDMIRSDTSLCLQKTLPIIQAKGAEFQKMFDRIDEHEAFVSMVKQNLSLLELQVEKAESEMGSLSTIKKVFNSFSLPSFLSSKKQPPPSSQLPPGRKPQMSYKPPPIFSVSEYFGPDHTDGPDQKHPTSSEGITQADHKKEDPDTPSHLSDKFSDLQTVQGTQGTPDGLKSVDDVQNTTESIEKDTEQISSDITNNSSSPTSEDMVDVPRMSRDADSGIPASVPSGEESP